MIEPDNVAVERLRALLSEQIRRMDEMGSQLADVTELARRYATPACNVGAHALAVQILHVLGVREPVDTSLLNGGDE